MSGEGCWTRALGVASADDRLPRPPLRARARRMVWSIGDMGIVRRYRDTMVIVESQEVAMRPPNADHSAAQTARDVHRDREAPRRPSDPTERRQRKALAHDRKRVDGDQPTAHPASPVGDAEPVRAFPGTDSRLGSPTVDYGPPTGHIVGHRIGEPPPRPRDPNRPSGRTGPYADVVVRHDVRPLLTGVVVRHDVRPLLAE